MRLPRGERFQAFERLLAPAGSPTEDRRRRSYVAVCLMLMIPLVVGFGVEDFRKNPTEAMLVMAMALLLTGILIALARVRDVKPIFRLGGVAAILLQFFELKVGGGGGYAFFWFYCIPILAMTVFGQREGRAWVTAALISAALGFLTPLGYAYEPWSVLRFLIIYVIIAIISYGLESSRHRYYSELLEEKVSLEEALARVKTLRGLLPICSRCKMVRDDKGYWQEIEEFVGRHSDAEFSHGLCPECVTRMYPDLEVESLHVGA